MVSQGTSTPSRDPITDPETGLVHWRWLRWFRGWRDDLDKAAQRIDASVALTGQTAAISTTAIPTAALSAGLYRVGAITRVTVADGVSSSVTVTISWTRLGVACSVTMTANTGDATTSVVSEAVPLIRVDAATPVSYAAAYSSATAGKMTYELDVSLERIEA